MKIPEVIVLFTIVSLILAKRVAKEDGHPNYPKYIELDCHIQDIQEVKRCRIIKSDIELLGKQGVLDVIPVISRNERTPIHHRIVKRDAQLEIEKSKEWLSDEKITFLNAPLEGKNSKEWSFEEKPVFSDKKEWDIKVNIDKSPELDGSGDTADYGDMEGSGDEENLNNNKLYQ